ncbi:hypothetical protein ACVWXS_002389 [Lysinibacillus sp. TE18511]
MLAYNLRILRKSRRIVYLCESEATATITPRRN